jgi:pyridoxamine 5'-phosphate oxidase
MTLSTVDESGRPDARVLLLKDVDASGWHFATSKGSPKGVQIAANSHVALTFYWQPLARQVRIRGIAKDMGANLSGADFRARSISARAIALLERQSDELTSEGELGPALGRQFERLAIDQDLVSPSWTVFAVQPNEIEFWQGHEERRHTRLRYTRDGALWSRSLLWP